MIRNRSARVTRLSAAVVGAAAGFAMLAGTTAHASESMSSATYSPTSVEGLHVASGYPSEADCKKSQSNYARYYRIVAQCFYNIGFGSWQFSYEDR